MRIAVPNPSNVNSSVEHLSYVGDVADQRLRCLLFLYAQIIHEPCFNHLRTKQQLGYIVGSQPRRAIGFCGMRILVQSEREASFVEGRIEHFLAETMTKLLEGMSDEEFEREKESLVNKKLEERKNAFEESARSLFSPCDVNADRGLGTGRARSGCTSSRATTTSPNASRTQR